jgi:hypothetical protein
MLVIAFLLKTGLKTAADVHVDLRDGQIPQIRKFL